MFMNNKRIFNFVKTGLMVFLTVALLNSCKDDPEDKYVHTHTLSEWTTVQELSCLDDHIEAQYCVSDPDNPYVVNIRTVTEAPGSHDYELDYSTVEDCEIGGVEYYVCSRDSTATNEIVIQPGTHTWIKDETKDSKEVTCCEDGYEWKICAYSDVEPQKFEFKATGDHDWGDWHSYVYVDADGHNKTRTCKNYSEKTETVYELHNFKTVEIPASKDGNGEKYQQCSDCGYIDENTRTLFDYDWIQFMANTATGSSVDWENTTSQSLSISGNSVSLIQNRADNVLKPQLKAQSQALYDSYSKNGIGQFRNSMASLQSDFAIEYSNNLKTLKAAIGAIGWSGHTIPEIVNSILGLATEGAERDNLAKIIEAYAAAQYTVQTRRYNANFSFDESGLASLLNELDIDSNLELGNNTAGPISDSAEGRTRILNKLTGMLWNALPAGVSYNDTEKADLIRQMQDFARARAWLDKAIEYCKSLGGELTMLIPKLKNIQIQDNGQTHAVGIG